MLTVNSPVFPLFWVAGALILLSPLWINAFLYMLMARLVLFFVPEQRLGGITARRLSLVFVLLDITSVLASFHFIENLHPAAPSSPKPAEAL